MKLKTNTWLLIFLTMILGLWVYTYELKKESSTKVLEQQQQQLFTFTEDDLEKITIQKANHKIQFVKTTQADSQWQMTVPEKHLASDGALAFLVDLAVNGKPERSFKIPAAQKSEYGLEPPQWQVKIELKDGNIHTIFLGYFSVDQEFIYALKNPQLNQPESKIFLVSKNWQFAVDREFEEWLDSDNN